MLTQATTATQAKGKSTVTKQVLGCKSREEIDQLKVKKQTDNLKQQSTR